MVKSLGRIYAVFLRYLLLHKRSVPRTLELVFWPVMDLLVWGFLAVYIQATAQDGLGRIIVFLINALIFWDILYRSQQGVSISFVEDIWTQNIVNLLVSPLRLWEWLAATFAYGMVKSLTITAILTAIAYGLYRYDMIGALGPVLPVLIFNLLFFGWSLGVVTSALMIRWGHAAEALIWGIPFLIQPVSAVFYPVSVLPAPLQFAAKLLPTTYVFEGMRSLIRTGHMPPEFAFFSLGLNLAYFLAAALFFRRLFRSAYKNGNLGRLGMD